MDMMITEVRVLLEEVRNERLRELRAEQVRVDSRVSAGVGAGTRRDRSSGNELQLADLRTGEKPGEENGELVVDYAQFATLVRKVMNKLGKAYVYAPKKKAEVAYQMMQAAEKEVFLVFVIF